jgi:hypothetical protein
MEIKQIIRGIIRENLNEGAELHENPFNQRLQKAPGGETLPAPAKGTVEKHGRKFKEGDMVVPHTGPHAGVPHKVTTARAGTVNIHPMVSLNNHKYDNTTIRAKHEHLSPYKKQVKESLDEVAIIKNGRKFSNARRFETDKEANDFLEKNPEYGMLHADAGGVYVTKNKNKGAPLK